jgi:hypothetical protein
MTEKLLVHYKLKYVITNVENDSEPFLTRLVCNMTEFNVVVVHIVFNTCTPNSNHPKRKVIFLCNCHD